VADLKVWQHQFIADEPQMMRRHLLDAEARGLRLASFPGDVV
jgi:hypothetical protein